jgi:hypothetical protein
MMKIGSNAPALDGLCIWMMQISSMYIGHEEDINFILLNHFQSKCPLCTGPWCPLYMNGIVLFPECDSYKKIGGVSHPLQYYPCVVCKFCRVGEVPCICQFLWAEILNLVKVLLCSKLLI